MRLTNKDIINLAAAKIKKFADSLRDIVAFRPQLTLLSTEEKKLGGLASVAIEWVSSAVQPPPNAATTEGLIRQAIVPHEEPLRDNHSTLAEREYPFLDITDDLPPIPSRRAISYPAVPEHLNTPKIPPLLRRLKNIKSTQFPTPDISKSHFHGPGILIGLLHNNNTVSEHVGKRAFELLANGRPGAPEFEAVSIARSLD